PGASRRHRSPPPRTRSCLRGERTFRSLVDPRAPVRRERVGGQQLDEPATIPEVCLDEQANRHSVSGSVDDLDGVTGANLTRFYDPQVRPAPARRRKALQEPWLAHPDPELETREPRLGHLEQRRPYPPALADLGGAEVDPNHGEVLTERTRRERLGAQLDAPPFVVLMRLRIHGSVGPAVTRAIGLIVAIEIHTPQGHAPCYRVLPDRSRHRPLPVPHSSRKADIHLDEGCAGGPAQGRLWFGIHQIFDLTR